MQLKRIEISGFQAISHDKPLILDNLSSFNVCIGPNNVGKSSIFRFMLALRQHVLVQAPVSELSSYYIPSIEDYWRKDNVQPIRAEIRGAFGSERLLGPDNYNLAHDEEWRLQVEFYKDGTLVKPNVFRQDKWLALCRLNDAKRVEWLTPQSAYTENFDVDIRNAITTPAQELMREIASQFKFFSPIRALDRPSGKDGMESGAQVINQLLVEQQQRGKTQEFELFTKSLLKQINGLLESSGVEFDDLAIKGDKDVQSVEVKCKGRWVDIFSMGNGVHELFMVCVNLVRTQDRSAIFFIEEPESHLHPGLQRRYVDLLKSNKNIQFIINTHSNMLLESLDDTDRTYLIQQDADQRAYAVPCKEFSQFHEILDRLGINNASLLQANTVIWVEGPSDRLYIRKWLTDFASDNGENLLEGSDYALMFYGGKLLSHLSLDDPGMAQDMLSVLRISRFSAIVMDADAPPGPERETSVRKTKQHIIKAAKEDPQHRLALLTDGREIENDVPTSFLLEAVCEELRVPPDRFAGFKLTGEHPFYKDIASWFKTNEQAEKQIGDKLQRAKIDLAAKVVGKCDSAKLAPYPRYIEPLYRFILNSRCSK